MMAGDFGVVKLDGVRRIATELEDRPFQFEANALIDSPNHKKRGHVQTPRFSPGEKRKPTRSHAEERKREHQRSFSSS